MGSTKHNGSTKHVGVASEETREKNNRELVQNNADVAVPRGWHFPPPRAMAGASPVTTGTVLSKEDAGFGERCERANGPRHRSACENTKMTGKHQQNTSAGTTCQATGIHRGANVILIRGRAQSSWLVGYQ